jgi:hypothetical protein
MTDEDCVKKYSRFDWFGCFMKTESSLIQWKIQVGSKMDTSIFGSILILQKVITLGSIVETWKQIQ